MVLAAAVGIPSDYIDMLRNEPKERSWNHLRYLVSKRKVKPLIIGYHLPVQQRGKLLFADWRDVRGRFPTLCRTVEKFKDGRALSHIDRQYLRGIMRSWARWHGLDALAQRLNRAQAALDEALARSSYLSTLPDALTGSASTMATRRGTLKLAILVRANAMMSSPVGAVPAAGTTKAMPTSPRRSSGTPTTATWDTSGWASRRSSISAG